MAGGRLDPAIANRLLLAAASMDAAIVFVLTKIAMHAADDRLTLPVPEAEVVVFGVAVGGVYWILTELLLGGRTAGRLCLGLAPIDAKGRTPGASVLVSRLLLKASTLGLGGLRLARPAFHDRATGIAWHSGMQPKPSTPIETWRLVVDTGPDARKSLVLGSAPGYARTKSVKIGRDPDWADLVLNDPLVSSRHCALMVRGGVLCLQDLGRDGKGSQNGTSIHGRRLAPGGWAEVGGAGHFQVAKVRIRILR